jgi:N-acetylglucosaminyldiphosphoundecaprenol N-acetyl-beta-D-mannosaminyltransferase
MDVRRPNRGNLIADVSGLPVRHVLGVDLAALTRSEVVSLCRAAVADGRRLEIGVVNAAKIVNMRKDPRLSRAVSSCTIVVADGQAVVWAARLLRQPLPERVAGIDLFFDLLGAAAATGHRVYFLGATDEVVRLTVENAKSRHPGLIVAGARDGYFSDDEADEVADEIRESAADLLFLGMTSPKKENFVAQHGARSGALVVHGVGGSFDILAGKTRRAPEPVQRLGMEWAYRIYQEPRRMWRRYLVTNSAFIAIVMRDLAVSHRRSASQSGPTGWLRGKG